MINENINICVIKTKIGNILIETIENKISKVLPTNKKKSRVIDFPLLRLVKKEINYFLDGKIFNFSFSLELKGSNFQKRVWKEIKKIEYGKTTSYLDISKKFKTSPRAIARACSSNKCLFLVPCHRIIYSNGNLGGYLMGEKIKKFILNMEKV